jgi:hypothetical protein
LPNGKKYYGLTIDLDKRKYRHKCHVKKGTKNKFYNAIRKYGWDSIEWLIIEEYKSKDKIELSFILNEREIYWIEKDKTYLSKYGYNMTNGGDGVLGLKWNEDSKKKLSNIQQGRKLSSSHRNNISIGIMGREVSEETKRKIGEKNRGNTYCLGIKRSKETIKKMSNCKLGKNNPMFGKEPANKGKKMTEEQKQKLREIRKLNKLKKLSIQNEK